MHPRHDISRLRCWPKSAGGVVNSCSFWRRSPQCVRIARVKRCQIAQCEDSWEKNHWVLLWHTSKVSHLSLIISLVNRLCNWQYFPKSPDTVAKPIPSTPIHKNSGLKVRLKTQDLAAQKQRLEANLLLKEKELATAKEKRLKGRGFLSGDNLNGRLSWRGVLLCFNASKQKACRTWMKIVQVHLGRHLYSAPQFWGHLCQIQCDRRGLFVDFTDPLYFMMLCYNYFALRLWEVFFLRGCLF